jgi:hypothetical protein
LPVYRRPGLTADPQAVGGAAAGVALRKSKILGTEADVRK